VEWGKGRAAAIHRRCCRLSQGALSQKVPKGAGGDDINESDTMTPLINGWVIALAIVCGMGGLYVAEFAERRRMRQVNLATLALMLLAGIYLLIAGNVLLAEWVNPFADSADDVRKTVHTAKGFALAAIIAVWPYVLIVLGMIVALVSLRTLRGLPSGAFRP
jgi:H+/Cl- antiporter ClcA